ncbi:MAG: endonuclease MutS2, partial [Clostridiales bacterium]|nr:endonuclease MutS2 [Clostridiales bacterium]
KYRFLLISGPNTGGKTVSLKMVGLFSLMAMCGLFIPASRAKLSVFDEIYCDVGDSQSIEDSLSTFSSHITNIIHIVENANAKSLVLIDELGGGTDPDEGQALAKAILSHLLTSGCKGVVTTHYTSLKEFAFQKDGIENACMAFDSNTLQALYIMQIGLPGSSNALGISRRLGLKESVLQEALSNLSKDAQHFENIVRSAEESRIKAEETLKESNRLKAEWEEKLSALQQEKEKLIKEKEKLQISAKAEARRIINERSAQAEELLEEMEKLFAKETLTEADLIKARTLKNKLGDKVYDTENEELIRPIFQPAHEKDLAIGKKVYVQNINQEGIIQNLRPQKQEAEVLCGNIRVRSKFSDLSIVIHGEKAQAIKDKKRWEKNKKAFSNVEVKKSLVAKPAPALELNVIGKTVHEALPDVEAFLDSAIIANLEEVRIVHGMGTGKLRAGIHEFLRTHRNVAEFRLGKYGEGDTGVTIVKIK